MVSLIRSFIVMTVLHIRMKGDHLTLVSVIGRQPINMCADQTEGLVPCPQQWAQWLCLNHSVSSNRPTMLVVVL